MRSRPFWLRWSVLLGMFCAALPGTDLLAQDVTRAELLQLNQSLFDSMLIKRDSSLFAMVALDKVVVIAPGGIVETRQQVIAGLVNFRLTSISIENVEVVIHDSTAVVVGRLTTTGELQGIGSVAPLRFLNVFVRTGGTWRLLARSLTPCAERALATGRC